MTNRPSPPGGSLRVLMDTNIILAIEGDREAQHVNNEQASAVYRLIHAAGGQVSIIDNQLDDFSRIMDQALQQRRHRQLRKYPRLGRLDLPSEFLTSAGYSSDLRVRSNDGVDAALLLALQRNAASWLITEDRRLHSHARRLGLQERVMGLEDALGALSALSGRLPPHYTVDEVEPHTLDPNQAFFESLSADYLGFPLWWEEKVVAERRTCLLIGHRSEVRGLAVLDRQQPEIPGLPENSIKICTFKIGEANQGRKLGETLLEAVIAHVRAKEADGCFIEAAPRHEALLALLKEFGFFEMGLKPGAQGDIVLGKVLNPALDDSPPTHPLEFNRRYGPGQRLVQRAFIVPIVPSYHGMLFPASEPQLSLFDSTYGNAVRKVYICHSPMKTLAPGDTLFFLRTHERQAVQAVGVVEETLRTSDLAEVLSFSGARTVYSVNQLQDMCAKELLAIKFRLDQVLEQPVGRNELRMLSVFGDSPQSIAQVRSEDGMKWAKSLQDA